MHIHANGHVKGGVEGGGEISLQYNNTSLESRVRPTQSIRKKPSFAAQLIEELPVLNSLQRS